MEISFLDQYEIEWIMNYVDLQEIPKVLPEKQSIQILLKVTEERTRSIATFFFPPRNHRTPIDQWEN